MRRIVGVADACETTCEIETLGGIGVSTKNDTPKMCGSMVQDVMQQERSQSSTPVTRQHIKPPQAARRVVLATDAADGHQFAIDRRPKERLAGFVEPVVPVLPLFTEPRHKPESFTLARRQ